MLKYLNPVNWFKAAVAAKVKSEIDEKITKEYLTEFGREKINYLINLSEAKVDDEKTRAISADLVFCGNSLIELGNAIDPSGEEGRKLSPNEVAALTSRLQVLFGDVISDEKMEEARTWAKNFISDKLGL